MVADMDMDIHKDKVMILKMYISRDDDELRNRYLEKASEVRLLVEKYLNRYFGEGEGDDVHLDCGFDLFCPDDLEVESGSTIKVNMMCKCAMTCMGVPCGFYLYPRSSVGAKTPLRLANSVGIIDSGYRGDCIAVFDNREQGQGNGLRQGEGSESGSYHIAKGDRLVQICSGNLLYPIYPIIVDSEEELGDTMRGVGGFGSTGR